MQKALAEAQLGWGNTHPNPMVGAVLVHAGEIVSRGYHARAGDPHAEVMALGTARGFGRRFFKIDALCNVRTVFYHRAHISLSGSNPSG